MQNLKSNTLSVTLYLDTRRVKKNGKFPLKLSIYSQRLNLKKLFPTNYEFTESDFNAIYKNSKVSARYRELSNEIKTLEIEMTNLAKSIIPFSFERFQELQDIGIHDSKDILVQMEMRHKKSIIQNKHSSNWITSRNSFLFYQEFRLKRKVNSLKLSEIDENWLSGYEQYMIKNQKSLTTVAIYLRNLKTIFNAAIKNGIYPANSSPFGRGKYVIAETSKVNKVLTKEQIEKLLNLTGLTALEEQSRDYWLFSFISFGINLIDMALLLQKNLNNDMLTFVRWKTKGTRRTRVTPINIPIKELHKSIINKYHTEGSPYIYPIFDGLKVVDGDPENYSKQHYYRLKDFNKKLNRGLKSISPKLGLTESLTMYWARHSFATWTIMQEGIPVEALSQLLGHKDIKTTQNYIGRIEKDTLNSISERLVNVAK
jgi:integrase/recombinase XerD